MVFEGVQVRDGDLLDLLALGLSWDCFWFLL